MKKAQQKFKVGDVVRLKSGGLFTVLELGGIEHSCGGAPGSATIVNEYNTIYIREPDRVLEPAEAPKGSRLASGAGKEKVLAYTNYYFVSNSVGFIEDTREAAAEITSKGGQLCKLVAL